MKQVMVRYTVKPDRVAENERYVAADGVNPLGS
jgi:hypothetical protein